MVFHALVKFVLICFDSLAWPLFALGFPLRASIQAIEANSNITETKKLITYWIIFSLISLFEHAFMGILQWLPFWPYMKLAVVCWATLPHFDGALYVYNHFVHPCVSMDLPTINNWFKKQQDFSLKINFLAEAADENVKAHEPPQVLEKLLANEPKGTEPSILQKGIKPVQVTEKREVAPVNSENDPNAVQRANNTITLPGIEGEASFDLPEIRSDKQVQEEWTCAMCQVTTTSEKNLNSHLQGRKHMNACEKLVKAKNEPSKGNVGLSSVVKVKHSEVREPQKHGSSSNIQGSQKKPKLPKRQASASSMVPKDSNLPSNNSSTCNKAMNTKTETSGANLPKEESKKSLPTTNMAGNRAKSSENVQGKQQVGKEHSETKIPQFRCTICNISCGRSEDLNCHLWGKKHLAQIQKLNNLRKGELA